MRRLVWFVYRKEMVETLRDRRTLLVMVLLPIVLYPLVGIGLVEWVGSQVAVQRARTSLVRLIGPRWPALSASLRGDKGRVQLAADAAGPVDKAVREGAIDAALIVPVDFRARLARDQNVAIRIVYDETRDASKLARRRVRAAVKTLSAQLIRKRLARVGLTETIIKPVELHDRDVATSSERGGHILSRLLPTLVVLFVLLGAFYPAIDLTAGEKERGTLETLLAAPVPRVALITGKYFVVVTVALATGVLNMAAMGLTFALGFRPALQQVNLDLSIPWSAIVLTGIALVPAALFFSAVMVAVAALAKSFKEAQNLLTPMFIVFAVPALLAQGPGLELGVVTAAIPVINIALLARELIGGAVPPIPTLVVVLSTTLYAAIALRIAARIYNSERLLFSAIAGDSRPRHRGPLAKYPDSSAVALLVLAVMAGLLMLGRPLQARHLIGGLLFTEWVVIALPVAVFIRRAHLDPRAVLALVRPSRAAMVGALLAGASAWFLVGLYVQGIQQRLMPMPKELLQEAQRMVFDPSRSIWVDLFALALSPAICEELLFRGLILRATRRTMSTAAVVAVNAVLFGLFHLSVYRIVPTMALGALLAFIVLRTGSIWPAMLFHFLNNAAAIVAGRLSSAVDADVIPWGEIWPAVGAAAVAFIAGAILIVTSARPAET